MVLGALARLRTHAAQSRGRRYPEAPHPYRNEFQRDRDRIIHTRAFRRLEDKTQVFTAGISDHFRNRLTHTIEVAQIARTVAAVLGLDEDLTEALALAHDIGHPPFAHAGEEELDRQMQRYGERFDHNLHSLRIVEQFEQRYARFPGLNLTFEVREGILKHSRDYAPGEHPIADEYLPGLKPVLEAQLIDLTDEIAYNTADLDDGFSGGFFSFEDVRCEIPELEELAATVDTQFPGASERLRFQELVRALIDVLVSGLIEGTQSACEGIRDAEQVRRQATRVAQFTPAAAELNRALKNFLHRRLYHTPVLKEERRQAAVRIAELFSFLMNHPEHLPQGYEPNSEPLHWKVCDYIAGMTDGYFARSYERLLSAGRM